MYQKYFTEALVLSHRDRGEAHRVFSLYTKEFGLIFARASAVRLPSSKMRHGLQLFSRAHVALIRGKRGWRLAGVSDAHGVRVQDIEGLRAFARISALVERLVIGEEKQEYLFSVLREAHTSLTQVASNTTASIELVCAARVLFALGYLSPAAHEEALFSHTTYGSEHVQHVEEHRDTILASVNRAIAAAQL